MSVIFNELMRQLSKDVYVCGSFEKAKAMLTDDEFQEFFSKSRKHGIDGKVYPFSVGASDAPIIMGVSNYKTPTQLLKSKLSEEPEYISEDTKLLFKLGHILEAPQRELFTYLTGIETEECESQFANKKYPHIRVNIDGLIMVDGKIGLYEGKTTQPNSKVRDSYENLTCPMLHFLQTQAALEILELDFGYNYCCWNHLSPVTGSKALLIKRDRELGKIICETMEKFVTDAEKGIEPDDNIVKNLDLKLEAFVAKNVESIGSEKELDDLTDKKDVVDTFCEIKKLTDEAKEIKQTGLIRVADLIDILNIEELTDKIVSAEQIINEAKAVEDKKKEILKEFFLEYPAGGEIVLEDGVYKVKVSEPGFSFDNEVKKYFKEKYPEAFEDISTRKLTPPRLTFSYKAKKQA